MMKKTHINIKRLGGSLSTQFKCKYERADSGENLKVQVFSLPIYEIHTESGLCKYEQEICLLYQTVS